MPFGRRLSCAFSSLPDICETGACEGQMSGALEAYYALAFSVTLAAFCSAAHRDVIRNLPPENAVVFFPFTLGLRLR